MAANTDILGQGWQFPFSFSPRTGGVGTSTSVSISDGIAHVIQSIEQILGTPIGERVMLRDFGSFLHTIVFEPNDPTLGVLAEHYVRTALERWEPRVILDRIYVEQDGPALEISIAFTIIRTQVKGNMVYPYHLEDGPGRARAVAA